MTNPYTPPSVTGSPEGWRPPEPRGGHTEHCDCYRQSRASNASWVKAYRELQARAEATERRVAELERSGEQLQAERDERGSALAEIEHEISEFFDNDCPETDPVAMVRHVLSCFASTERAHATLLDRQAAQPKAIDPASHSVLQASCERLVEENATLARDLAASTGERDAARDAITTFAAYWRGVFAGAVFWNPEEQAFLDFAAALTAPPAGAQAAGGERQ